MQNTENDNVLRTGETWCWQAHEGYWLTDTQQRKEQLLNDQAKTSMLSIVDFGGRANQ